MDTPLQTLLLVVAIIAATAWIVSLLVLEFTKPAARPDGPQPELANTTYAQRHARVAGRVTAPAALVALGAGIWLALDQDRSTAGDWWLGSLLGLWIVAFFGSLLLRAPRLRAAVASAEANGDGSEDVRWRVRQMRLLARGELLVLCVAVALVIIQPA